MMKNIISFCIACCVLTILFTSCQSGNKNDRQETTTPATAILDIDTTLAQGESLTGTLIEIEGVCTHICKHGGRKIFLMGSDDSHTLRIEAAQDERFDAKCINNIVQVKGILVEERIDEAYLQRWEEKLAAQTAEKHGNGEEGCSTEKKARGETANTPQNRIEQFRKRIADQKNKNGKEYLSFYHLQAQSYQINE